VRAYIYPLGVPDDSQSSAIGRFRGTNRVSKFGIASRTFDSQDTKIRDRTRMILFVHQYNRQRIKT